MYFALRVSVVLTLGLGVLAAGFLLRTYIVFHDCAHGSFLPSKRGEHLARQRARRARLRAVPQLAPQPRRAPRDRRRPRPPRAGRRADADGRRVPRARRGAARLGYRLFRNPLVMFGLGPLFAMILGPRIVPRDAAPADPPQRARRRTSRSPC